MIKSFLIVVLQQEQFSKNLSYLIKNRKITTNYYKRIELKRVETNE